MPMITTRTKEAGMKHRKTIEHKLQVARTETETKYYAEIPCCKNENTVTKHV